MLGLLDSVCTHLALELNKSSTSHSANPAAGEGAAKSRTSAKGSCTFHF